MFSAYGLDIGLTKRLRKIRDINLGLQLLLGYRYLEIKDTATEPFFPFTNNMTSDEYRVAIGPDLEYPVSAAPGLSIGARIMMVYDFTKTDEFVEETGLYLAEGVLTARYRF